MPRVNIYIRKEDEEKWLAIENRPEWLHLVINSFSTDPMLKFAANIEKENKKLDHLLKHPEEVKLEGLAAIVDDTTVVAEYDGIALSPYKDPFEAGKAMGKLCQHYQPKGRCLVKGCK